MYCGVGLQWKKYCISYVSLEMPEGCQVVAVEKNSEWKIMGEKLKRRGYFFHHT